MQSIEVSGYNDEEHEEADAAPGPVPDDGADGAGDDEGEDNGGGEDGDGDPTVKLSKKACMEKISNDKTAAGNLIRYACSVVARRLSRRLFKILAFLPDALETAFNQEAALLKTRSGSKHLHETLFQGEWAKTMHSVFCTLLSPTFAKQCGFASDTARRPRSLVKEDQQVAVAAYKMAVGTMGASMLTNLHYQIMPPLCFAGLTHPVAEWRTRCQEHCKKLKTVVERLEHTGLTTPKAQAFVQSLTWPAEHWARQILVRLEENDFQDVFEGFDSGEDHSFGLRGDLLDYSEAQSTSLLCEYSFGDIRRSEKRHLNGSLVPLAAYHGFCNSCRLTDFDRPAVPITPDAQQAAASGIAPGLFDEDPQAPDEEPCSLDEALLDSIHEAKPSWFTTSLLNFRMGALRMQCALHMNGVWTSIDGAWPSLLVEPGCIIKKEGMDVLLLVVLSSRYGVLCYRVGGHGDTADVRGRLKALEYRGAEHFSYFDLTEYKRWQCADVRPGGPGCEHDPRAQTDCISLFCIDPFVPLVVYAARRGFKGLAMFHLRKLYADAAIQRAAGVGKPKTVAEFVTALAYHYIDGLTPGGMIDILMARDHDDEEPALENHFDATPAVWNAIVDCVEDQETALRIAEIQTRSAEARRRAAEHRAELDAVQIDAPGVANPVELRALPWPAGRGFRQPEAKQFLPPGARIKKSMKAKRWFVEADWLWPSRSKAFTETSFESDNDALCFVLVEAWYSYPGAEQCPWLLQPPMF